MSGEFSRRAALSYRQCFALRWQRFLQANFDSPEHAAAVFGVDGSTSRKWWAGEHRPSGDVVGWAFEKYPEQAANALRR